MNTRSYCYVETVLPCHVLLNCLGGSNGENCQFVQEGSRYLGTLS